MHAEIVEYRGAGGLRLVAHAVGHREDPAVLLLHGGGQTRHSWRATAQQLAARGWYAVAMDLRGHGDSEWAPDGDYSTEAFAADIVAVSQQLGRPVLVGASLGGTSALAALGATADAPCGCALVLVDIAPHIQVSGAIRVVSFMAERSATGFASLDEVADAVHAYNPHRPKPTDLSGLRKNVRQRADGRWYWHWDPAFLNGRADRQASRSHRAEVLESAARSLTVPTLLIRGRQSDLLSEADAQRFLATVPHARYADVSDAGHMVAGDRNDVFSGALLSFLDDLGHGRVTDATGAIVDPPTHG